MSTDTDSVRRTSLSGLFAVLRHDVPASVVVFLVALPLSIGIAVAVGAPVAAGLIAAVVGALVAGLCGGSALQVSGPTASLTVVVAESIQQFGWAVTCFVTLGAGVLQILFGLGRIGRGALAIAPVVVHGMLAGTGVVLVLQQAHVLLGGQSLGSAWDCLAQLPHQVMAVHGGDALVGGVVIAVLLGWRYLPAAARSVPAPLAAVAVAAGLALLAPTTVERITLGGTLFDDITLPALPHGGWPTIGLTMLTVAVIASVETLLSAVAVERMRPRPKARRGEEVEARRDEEVEARRGEKGEARRDEKGEAQRGHKIEVLRGRKVKARRGQKVEGHRGQKVEARRGEKVEARRGERVEAQQGHEVEARWGNEIEARRGREVKARRSYEEEERPGYEEEVRRGRGEEVRRGREVKVRWGREVKVRRGHKGRTDLDRELVGQGMANVVSGLVGGLPVAAVIVRSVVNVKAGARSRVSTMLSGGWMLVFAVALVDVVRQIPRAALAGVLIVIGMGLVKLAYVRMARRTGDLVVYAATVLVVVFGNLLLGMVVGLVLAFALLLWRVVRVAISARPVGGGRWLVTVDGTCTFLALPRLVGELAAVPPAAPVIVELTVDFLDHAAHDALRDWADGHEKSGGTVEFVEMGADRRLLDDVLGPWRRTAQGDPIVAGVAAYHRRHAHLVRPHLGRLRDVQHPDSLFLTCADSRIVPNVITNSGPGDLFTVRNIGNLVPADGRDSSVEAALVYALDTLRVRSVVVCGHSGCGAMDALFHERVTGPGLDDWLAHGRPALDRYRAGHPVAAAAAEAGFGEIDRLGMVNVAVQLEALTRHPVVRRAVLARGVVLSGLFFDISTARVLEITIDGVDEIEDTTEPATALPV